MKTKLIAPLLFMALFSQGCIIVSDNDPDSDITIYNDSDYILYEIYVSPIGASTWGPDLLGSDILYPDESVTVAVDCATYDVMVVDEYDVACVLEGINVCYESATWYVSNSDLAFCDFFGALSKAEKLERTERPADESAQSEEQQAGESKPLENAL